MSANGLPSLGGLGDLGSLSLGASRKARSQEEELEALPEWQRLFLSGAPEVDVERAKQYGELYGPTGLRNVAGELGQEPPDNRRGLLESFADYATRLQSATTGFVTGLTGMERRRETFGTGVESGELFDRPESAQAGLGLALERFAQGLTGEERFQAADFGALAYDRETAGLGERFLKSSAGFVLDVALDPLTYVSFGGSILGRRLGAQAVNNVARKNAAQLINPLDAAAKGTATKNAVLRLGIDDSILTQSVRDLGKRAGFNLAPETGLMKTDDAIAALARIPGALDEVAMDAMAATSAAMYRSFGSGGLFRYLSDEFGEAGVQFWRQLPADIKGGVRFRVPFSGLYQRATGQAGELGGAIPKAFRLPGTGTGKLSKALGTDKLNNGMRSFMRSKRLLKGGADNLNGATGASNMATAQAIFKRNYDWQKGIVGEFDPKIDPKLRAVSWKSTDELEDSIRLLRAGALNASRQILEPLKEGTAAYRQGLEQGGEEFSDLFETVIKSDVAQFGGGAKGIEEVFGLADGEVASELQQLAYQSASGFQFALRDIESQMRELENSYAGFAPNFIQNYWPRIMDDIDKELGGRPMSSSFGNLRARDHFVAEFNPDGTVARWMTPREIAKQTGDDLFIQDAEKLMAQYVISMNKFLMEERFFQQLLDRGVLFRSGAEAMGQLVDITAASRTWMDGYNTLLGGRRALTGIGRGRLGDRLNAAGLADAALDAEVSEAERVARALQAGRRHGRRLLENYQQVEQGVWRSSDGTTISANVVGGSPLYTVTKTVNGQERYFTIDGSWSKKSSNGQQFTSFDNARRSVDEVLQTERSVLFVNQIERLRTEFLKDAAKAVRNFGDMRRNGMNPLEPGNITPANQADFFAAITDVIDKYGKDAGMVSRQVKSRAYKEGTDFGGGRGAAFRPAAMGVQDGPQVRQFWQSRMERLGIFGAETLVDDVRRIFAAGEKPEGFRKWVEEWYVPFYATQKALMTSQRGPGYVARNIQGGMWNAYLAGTTARHWRLAGTAKVAEAQARKIAEGRAPNNLKEQGVIAAAEFRRILNEKLGDRKGAQIADAWLSFEKRGLRGRTASSRTEGIQTSVGLGEPTGSLSRQLDADEMNFAQQAAQTITEDWWWARTMGRAAQGSEDYLRFGAFLRGVDLYGLEDGGRAASLLVRATQFDYADLSKFEANTVKMLVPFYTWTRNNVPLQVKAMIAEPGKVMRAIRINDSLADIFGEEDNPEEPLPSYVRERFGWRVRKDLWSGPMGDAISGGLVVGEPLVDVNRLFGSATATGAVAGPTSMLNWRELANQVNPIFGVGAEALTGVERTTGGRLPPEEDVPLWLRWTGFGREAGEDIPQMSARGLRAARELLPPIGIIERYAAPLLGNERLQRRWYTTLASAVFGLPVSTLDPYQTGAELRAQEQRLRGGLERQLGGDLNLYTSYVRRALNEGVTPEEMQIIVRDGLLGGRDIADVPVEELDQTAMVDTIRFMRRIMRMKASGVPQQTLDLMMDYFEPRTDAEQGVRSGKTPPLTVEQLAEIGETPQSVATMSPAERLEVLRQYMRKNPDWGTALP